MLLAISKETWRSCSLPSATVAMHCDTPPRVAKADEEVVLAAVSNDGSPLEFASALTFASQNLWSDREIVLAAVRRRGVALASASENLRGDGQVVLAAVRTHGSALLFASLDLRNNRDIVLAAVNAELKNREECALKYASARLQLDADIILAAVSRASLGCLAGTALPQLIDCSVNGNLGLVLGLLKTSPKFEYFRSSYRDPSVLELLLLLPNLKEVLSNLYVRLLQCGMQPDLGVDTEPYSFAAEWQARMEGIRWDLRKAFTKASGPAYLADTIVEFSVLPSAIETAGMLPTYAAILDELLRPRTTSIRGGLC